ncbi:N-glycosylase/DNA lyase [Episyrphus balteatus]|uniref:N-glycosylase/DNA lyase n=1 Tax=Episyrphus balteatus TaxID=286459 RepID=UPI00248695DA|nr:N-glycosylase/DNA lyase [Episyrphus balteatus]
MLLKLYRINFLSNYPKMSTCVKGKLSYPKDQLNLDLTLLGGQSFRWEKHTNDKKEEKWQGVAFECFWELHQTPSTIKYKVFSNKKHPDEYFTKLLEKYLRLDFDLSGNCEKWKRAHRHFAETSQALKAVRVLDQEPLETILSFICSQNNHIKRISTMVQWLCSKYGSKICSYEGVDYFSFPSLSSLCDHQNELESALREAKFGYRAKFIAGSVKKINESGGNDWFQKLRSLSFKEARVELVTLPGIGFKVADCICLMALNHLESVPIDTHIYKIAQASYLPRLSGIKSVTPKIYEEVAEHFRKIYGDYAGWAQAVLFCSGLQRFQETKGKFVDKTNVCVPAKKQKKK